MASVDFGASVAVSWTSANDGTAVLNLTAPDGTESTPTVVDTGTNHTSSFTASQAGRWLLRWVQATDGEVYTDIVDAWPADPRFLISLADAKAAISAQNPQATVNDDDLRIYVAAATPVIEDICGPIILDTVTQTAMGSKSAIVLKTTNIELTSITVDGNVMDPSRYTLDAASGVVWSNGHNFGGRVVTLVYQVGVNNVIPPNVRLGVREEVRFLWQIGKQGARPTPNAGQSAMSYTPSGFAVPKRVIELCSANARLGGFG